MSEQDNGAGEIGFSLIEALASSFGAAVLVYDGNDTLIYGSRLFLSFFPVSPEVLRPGARLRDLLGAAFDTVVQPAIRAAAMRPPQVTRDGWIADRIAIHWRERYESVEQLPDGRWIRLSKRRLQTGLLITTFTDVTEQKRRDFALADMRSQADLAQHILDNLANPVIVKDSQLRYVIVNDAFCKLLGMPSRNIVGRRAAELVGREAAAAFEESERAVLETGVPIEFVEDILRPDGAVLRSITRKRRSGTAGNHYVTISIDHIATFAADRNGHPVTAPDAGRLGRQPSARILVVDENRTRAADRAAQLVEAGNEAMALSDPREVFVFLDTAKRMGLTVDRAELSPAMVAMLASFPQSANHPQLAAVLGADEPAQPAASPFAPPAPAPSPGRRRVRVLVAEDNEVNQIVFSQILEGLDVEFLIVADGAEAVAAWRERSPDIILMDVSMPVMNGLEATAEIRAAEAGTGARVPIVAVTAHAMGGDRERCIASGMDDYLAKPVSPERIETAIRAMLGDKNFEVSAA